MYLEATMKVGYRFSNLVLLRYLARILSKMPFGDKMQLYIRKAEIEFASQSLIIKNLIDDFFSE